jgi:DNA-directed RNA polymerase
MTTISEYQAHRAAVTQVEIKAIPEVRPFARRHVAALETEGKGTLVLRQLVREAQSVRRTNTDETLLENAAGLNVDAIQAGYNALCESLATGKRTKNKVDKVEHKGGRFNLINQLTVEEQADAMWGGLCSLVAPLISLEDGGGLSVQTLAGAVAGRLRALTCGAPEYTPFAYERAALVLIDHLCDSTGWLVEETGETVLTVTAPGKVRKKQLPNKVRLTQKFVDGVLGGDLLPDLSERKPMLVPPVPWTVTATHGGYLHNAIPAVRGTREPIQSPEIVSALNVMQATPFRVNARVLAVAKTFRVNAEDLPVAAVLGELTEERHDVSEELQRSKTIRSALTIGALQELENEDEFWFPWNLDWRGRMYPATSLISPQGADLCKGCLEFADGTEIGREGGDWLAVLLCNLAGADKRIVETPSGLAYETRTPAERIEWAHEHSELIMAVAADPLNVHDWHFTGGFGREKIKRGKRSAACVDSPWQFLAACFEWSEFQMQGPGFRSRLAGALDGSCSGVQMLSGMTRDASAGAMVNLVPAPRGDDYYGRMAKALLARMCGMVRTADERDMEYLKYWSQHTIDRDLLKGPSMTKVYSAGTFTFGEQVKNKTGAPELESMWLARRINECFGDVAPGMLRAMAYLQEVSDVLTAENLPLVWRTPAGLLVQQERLKTESVKIETVTNNVRRARVFSRDTDELSKTKQRAGVAPNFVHGVDASHMVFTVNALHAQGVRNFWMVHDSFGAPLAQCQQVFDTTREQFVELMSGDLLREWTEAVTAPLSDDARATLPELPSYGDLDLAAVRDSVYAWY